MRILVTGGAGFIGSHLSERLIGDGHLVGILLIVGGHLVGGHLVGRHLIGGRVIADYSYRFVSNCVNFAKRSTKTTTTTYMFIGLCRETRFQKITNTVNFCLS